jgi:hypothetical protein
MMKSVNIKSFKDMRPADDIGGIGIKRYMSWVDPKARLRQEHLKSLISANSEQQLLIEK